MGHPASDTLETVADVAAAIEAAGNEVTTFQVTVDDGTARGTAHVTLPVVDAFADTACQFDLTSVTFEDGAIRIELDVAATTGETSGSDGASHTDAATAERSDPSADPDRADAPEVSTRSGSADRTTVTESAETADATPDDADDETAPETPSQEAGERPEAASAVEETPTADEGPAVDEEFRPDDDRPAYRDPDRLAAVYDPDATFEAMTEALGVDVTPQTVRKYMVDHGIHEPQSRASDALVAASADGDPSSTATAGNDDTDELPAADPSRESADAPAEAPEPSETEATDDDAVVSAASDGENAASEGGATTPRATDGGEAPTLSDVESLEIPHGVSAAEFIETVTSSRTVYEVRRGLGLEASEARSLLRRYDLIDLVTGRITNGSNPPSEQAVLSRLVETRDQAQ